MTLKVGVKFQHRSWLDEFYKPVACEVVKVDWDAEKVWFKCLSNSTVYWSRIYWFKRDHYGRGL